MAVFAGSTNVSRAVADPGTDNALPSSGALSFQQITGSSGVAGATGADVKLVHGDRWQQLNGSLTECCTGNVMTTIMQDEAHEVSQNHEFTVGQNSTTTVVGTHTGTHVGPQNLTFVSPQTESREGSHQTDESESKFENKPTHMENIYVMEFTSNTGIKSEVNSGMKIEVDNLFLGLTLLKSEVVIAENLKQALSMNMQGLRNRIMGVKAEAGGAEAKALPEVNVFVVFIPDGILG